MTIKMQNDIDSMINHKKMKMKKCMKLQKEFKKEMLKKMNGK